VNFLRERSRNEDFHQAGSCSQCRIKLELQRVAVRLGEHLWIGVVVNDEAGRGGAVQSHLTDVGRITTLI
jgi:hypothetical protein